MGSRGDVSGLRRHGSDRGRGRPGSDLGRHRRRGGQARRRRKDGHARHHRRARSAPAPPEQLVRARGAADQVAAARRQHPVVAAEGHDHVGARRAAQRVRARRADDRRRPARATRQRRRRLRLAATGRAAAAVAAAGRRRVERELDVVGERRGRAADARHRTERHADPSRAGRHGRAGLAAQQRGLAAALLGRDRPDRQRAELGAARTEERRRGGHAVGDPRGRRRARPTAVRSPARRRSPPSSRRRRRPGKRPWRPRRR